MLGNHEGTTPITEEQMDVASGEILKVLGRLKAGKDVPARRAVIKRAMARISTDDRYWMETLVGLLSEGGVIEGIPAHLAALAAGWVLCEDEVARIIRRANSYQRDSYTAETVRGLCAAAPEFARRLENAQVNSDEVLLRVALAHLFRRDPSSTFQMFVIDGAVRQLNKAMKIDTQTFVASFLERHEEEDVPSDAWGYVVVLSGITGRSGLFIPEPTDKMRAELQEMRKKMESFYGPIDDNAFVNYVATAFQQGYHKRGMFASVMAPALELIGHRCIVLYTREEKEGPEQGGVHSEILIIPSEEPAEARKIVLKMPEITMHDEFRRLAEMVAQDQERDTQIKM